MGTLTAMSAEECTELWNHYVEHLDVNDTSVIKNKKF